MRELKFRAWDHGRMLSHEEIHFGNAIEAHNTGNASNSSCILMQYTGLKDKNGKEIYEGDIIKWLWTYGKSEIEEVMHSTSWDGQLSEHKAPFMSAWGSTDGRYFRTFMNVYDPCRFAIVIGNIYQNPQLLNNEQGAQVSDTTKMPKDQKPD